MRLRRAVFASIAAASFTTAILARADRAPSAPAAAASTDESHCTPAEQCPHGEYCPYDSRPDAGDSPERQIATAKELNCVSAATTKKLEMRCRQGTGVGQALYCPRGETGSWKGAKGSGCSM